MSINIKLSKLSQIIKKSYQNSKLDRFDSISYQQVAQSIKTNPKFIHSLSQYVSQIKPFSFVCTIFRVFSSGIILYLLLNFIDVGFSIGLTFINKIINQQMRNHPKVFDFQIVIIFLQIFGIKLFTSSLLIYKYIIEGQLAAKIFAYQIANISNLLHLKESEVTGQNVNFIEDDSEKISRLPYLLSHTILLPTQVIVISIILAIYLPSDVSYFLGLIVVFVLICALIGYLSYSINQGLMKNKDKRIQSNLNGQDIIINRSAQLKRVRQYLILNLAVQLIAQVGYSTLFITIFWAGEDSMTKDDKYTALVLMNLLKSPMQRLTQIGLANLDNYNSLQRISKGTQPYQDTDKQSLLTEQSSQNKQKTTQKTGQLNILKFVKRKAILEKGNIKILKIYNTIRKGISLIPFLVLLIFFFVSIGVTIYSHYASQSVISQKFHPEIIIPIVLTNFSLIALMGIAIFISLKISKFATKQMSKVNSYEVLNRYAGDIRILDRSTCTVASTFLNVSGVFIGILIYTLISLSDLLIQVCFFLLVAVLIFIAYRINRYAMWSRRQLRRMQCLKKAQLIAKVTNANDHDKVLQVCQQLYVLKVTGATIQAYIIASALVVSILVCLLIICLFLSIDLPEATTLILLNFLMGMDNNVKVLLLNGLNLQIDLVSVQRCLNASQLKSDLQSQQQGNNQFSFNREGQGYQKK